jgi:hypothetical protein
MVMTTKYPNSQSQFALPPSVWKAASTMNAGKRSIPSLSNDRMGSAIAHGTAVEACRRQRAQAGRRFEGAG